MATHPRPELEMLVERWRTAAAQIDTYHATMGSGYKACANELAAAPRAAGRPQEP